MMLKDRSIVVRRYIMLVLLIVVIQEVDARPKDLKGWDKTRWGMKADAVRDLYKGRIRDLIKAEEYANGVARFEIAGYELFGHSADVKFVLLKNGSLVSVVFRFRETDSTKHVAIFRAIEKTFRKKYGKPSVDDKKNSNNKMDWSMQYSTHWNFPSTEILLTYFSITSKMNGEAVRFLTLVYNASEAAFMKIAK